MDQKPDAILAALKAAGLEAGDLKVIVLTHAHSDHMGALRAIRGLSGAKVLAHAYEAAYAEQGKSSEVASHSRLAAFILKHGPQGDGKGVPVDIKIDGDFDLRALGVNARVILTPGHTQGSLSVLDAAGEAAVGDLLRGKPGKLSFGPFCLNLSDSRRSLEKLLSLGATPLHFCPWLGGFGGRG
jgi:glyoxylase-like metal-dependent hydrolase (beta-lactamase superfamily II)